MSPLDVVNRRIMELEDEEIYLKRVSPRFISKQRWSTNQEQLKYNRRLRRVLLNEIPPGSKAQ
jgi:hypothetical protein